MLLETSDEIKPDQGLSYVQFGMTIAQVRDALGEPDSSFQKSETSEYLTDSYDRLGMHISYRSPGVCNAIEMFSPAEITLYGRPLIAQNFSQIRDWIQTIDTTVELDETGLTSYQFGLGLYAPFAGEEPDEPIESVIIFERGYYN